VAEIGGYGTIARMRKLLEEAVAKVETLPPAAQDEIGEKLLAHVNKVQHLRVELQKGLQSLARGEGKELNMREVIKSARAQHGRG
jgi:hypothetical protein